MLKNMSIFPCITAIGVLFVVSASGALGQQSTAQQTCVKRLNADGAAVAGARRGAHIACLKKAGAGTLVGSAQSCLSADALGAIQNQKKRDMTVAHETKYCGTPPTFGYTSAATVNSAAEQATSDLTADIFGANLDAAVIACASNKPGCLCQQAIMTKLWALTRTKLSKFVLCKLLSLRTATSSAVLEACVNNAGAKFSIAADTAGILQRMVTSLGTDVVNKCDSKGVTTGAFPGKCTGMTGSTLATCLDTQVECRVCQTINDMDGLFVNCDLFDDQTANGSCVSGTGPLPTATPTVTPTSTPTQTPTASPTATHNPGAPTFQGTLAATSGRFNYNLTLGLPGSNAACSTNFPGSHTCSYAELQTADLANELLAVLNTSFWAIDSAQPFNRQCNTNIPWDYQTAHTGRFGDLVPLTSGHLGSLMPSQVCANSHLVACCQ